MFLTTDKRSMQKIVHEYVYFQLELNDYVFTVLHIASMVENEYY